MSRKKISRCRNLLELLEPRQLLHNGVGVKINFQLPTTPAPDLYDVDWGLTYADRGEGIPYGWVSDNTAGVRTRHDNSVSDVRERSFAVLPSDNQNVWEIGLPNDDYTVHVVAGDAQSTGGHYRVDVEGVLTVDGEATAANPFVEGTQIVSVKDGRLTLSSANGSGTNKIDYIDIEPFDDPTTISVAVDPATQTRGSHGGGFIFTRSGSVTDAATYDYLIGGSANPGRDYTPLGNSFTFPIGSSEVEVPVTPDFKKLNGTKTVMVTLVPQDDFLVDQVSATTSITGTNRHGSVAAAPLATTSSTFSLTRINFQPSNAAVPDFYKADTGATYAKRANGMTYGWSADDTGNTRDRNSSISPDQRYDTIAHMQLGKSVSWEMAVPNGTYTVRVVAGDSGYTNSVYKINVEGVLTVNGTPSGANHWVEGTKTVTVKDGRLTISSATGSNNNKLDFVEIAPGSKPLPVVSVSASGQPAEGGATGKFTVTRTGDLSAALTVTYTLGGTAVNGSDYQTLSGAVTIPAKSASADITIKPINDTTAESTESVTMAISTSSTYSNGQTRTASRTITDNDINTTSGTLKWTTGKSAPSVRAEAMGAFVNGKVYAFGGYIDRTYHPTARVDVYDVASNSWKQLKDMPFGALTHAGVTTDGNFVYLAGGYPGHVGAPQTFSTTNVWRYDTTNDSWKAMPALPDARGAGTMTRDGRTIYFFGGADSKRADRSEMWSLNLDDPSAKWVSKASMPAARNHVGGVALNGFIYAIGGQTGQDNQSVFKSDVWRYDPNTNKWATVASLITQPRSHIAAASFVYNGKIVIEGGEGPGRVALRNVEEYDPNANKWTSLTPLPAGRSSGIGVSLNDGRILYTSGYSGDFESQTWIGSFS